MEGKVYAAACIGGESRVSDRNRIGLFHPVPPADHADTIQTSTMKAATPAKINRKTPPTTMKITSIKSHGMKQNSSREMERRNATKCFVFKVFIARFATRSKGLVSVLGAGALLAPVEKAESAVVLTSLFQDSGESAINYTFTNNDIGATYNSATLDLAAVLGSVVDAIVANNPNFNTNTEVYGAMSFGITNTGDVYSGWSSAIDPNTSMLTINPAGPFGYTLWTSASNQNTMTGTLNLGNMLDFNGNGIIDPNEVLIVDGIAQNAFTANSETGLTQWYSDSERFRVIPEPGTAALIAMAGAAFAFRRRRTDGNGYEGPDLNTGALEYDMTPVQPSPQVYKK